MITGKKNKNDTVTEKVFSAENYKGFEFFLQGYKNNLYIEYIANYSLDELLIRDGLNKNNDTTDKENYFHYTKIPFHLSTQPFCQLIFHKHTRNSFNFNVTIYHY